MLSTVLIIDKRIELSTKYKKSIEKEDVKVLNARELKDAILYIQDFEPELIIVSDSIEENLSDFCKKIRALTFNSRPVIIAVSKSADISDRINVLENGADDFLSEPVNIEEFKTRINAHIRREIESNLDNKTLLPNKIFVKKALKRVLSVDNGAVLLASIENLSDYIHVYTELAADKLIQTFIAIMKSILGKDDFVGQLSDEQFVIVTNKYSAEKLANFLVFAFETVIPKFYSKEDTSRGYMLLEGERKAGMRINFVSVLIGGITEGLNSIKNADTLLEKLREIQKLAKIPSGSNYAIERIKISGADSISYPEINKTIYIQEGDDSLNYLIRTSLELQGYNVQNTLNTEDLMQPSVIVIDSGNEFENLEYVQKLKGSQKFANTKIIVTATIHDKATILDKGADLYLPKPYEISDLIRWVEFFIKK